MKIIFLSLFSLILGFYSCTGLYSSTIAALGSNASKTYIWNWTNNQTMFTFPTNTLYDQVIFLNDSRLACQKLGSGKVSIWNITTGLEVTLNTNAYSLEQLTNGYLATGGSDSSVNIWNLTSQVNVSSIPFNSIVYSMKQLRICNFLAAGEANGGISIINTTDFRINNRLVGHTSRVSVIEDLRNGLILSGSYDGSIGLWKVDMINCLNSFVLGKIVYSFKLISESVLVIGAARPNLSVLNLNLTTYQFKMIEDNLLPKNATEAYDIEVTDTDLVLVSVTNGSVAFYNRTDMRLINIMQVSVNEYFRFMAILNPYTYPVDSNFTLCSNSNYTVTTINAQMTSTTTTTNVPGVSISNSNTWRSFEVVVGYTMSQSIAIGPSFQIKNRLKCLLVCANNPSCKATTYDTNQNCTSYFAYPPSNGDTLIVSINTVLYHKV